jgi:cytochrome c-type biogenesis protein
VDGSVGIGFALLAGVLSFLSPCVLPLVPSYLSFVTGMNLDELQETPDHAHVLTHSILFVSGFTVVFVVGGALASFLGQMVVAYKPWIARFGGLLIIVLGLHLLGVFRIGALMREKRVQLSDKPEGFIGTIVVGAAFGAGWTPCIGPILGGILTLAGTRETVWSGVALLLVYSIGLAIPFLLAALALDRFLTTYRRFRSWIPWMERASGAMLVALGLLLVTGSFTMLTNWLTRLTPSFLLERI